MNLCVACLCCQCLTHIDRLCILCEVVRPRRKVCSIWKEASLDLLAILSFSKTAHYRKDYD